MAQFSPWMPNLMPQSEEEMKLAMLKQQNPAATFLMKDPLKPQVVNEMKAPKPTQATVMPTRGPAMSSPSLPIPQSPAPSQGDDLDKQMRDAYMNTMKARQERIGEIENELKNQGERPTGLMAMDLSPLAALVDSWTGSKLTSGYNGPTAKKEWEGKRDKLQAALDKERGGLSDDELNYLKLKLQERNNKALLDIGRQARFDESQDLKKEDNIRKDVSKIADLFNQDMQGIDLVESSLATGDLPTIQATLSQFARRIGGEKGALSDGDVARAMPNTGVNSLAKLQTWLTGKGKIDPEVQAVMQNLAATAKQNAIKYQQERVNARRKSYEKGAYRNLMQPGAVGDVIFNEIGGQAPSGGNQQVPDDKAAKLKRLQELQAKAKGD